MEINLACLLEGTEDRASLTIGTKLRCRKQAMFSKERVVTLPVTACWRMTRTSSNNIDNFRTTGCSFLRQTSSSLTSLTLERGAMPPRSRRAKLTWVINSNVAMVVFKQTILKWYANEAPFYSSTTNIVIVE